MNIINQDGLFRQVSLLVISRHRAVPNVPARLGTGSFLVITPLINTTHLTGWWHIKGKSQSLCGKTCWVTTVLAHTGEASGTEMYTYNPPKHTHRVKWRVCCIDLSLGLWAATANKHVSYLSALHTFGNYFISSSM